jgi:arylsulfatase A
MKSRMMWIPAVLSMIAGVSASPPVWPAPAVPGERLWNIVFILADDMGWNQAGYHGSEYYETPNIDRIARNGIQFRDAYSSASICSPTRGAIMTGKAPARLHLTNFIPGRVIPPGRRFEDKPLVMAQQIPCLPLEESTIPEMLRPAGYVSGHFGKWHLGLNYDYHPGRLFDPASQGFDVVSTAKKPDDDLDPPPPDAHSAVETTRRAIEFIETHRSRPFLCFVAHNVVHGPLYEEESLIEKFAQKPGADRSEHNPIMGAMMARMDTGIGEIIDTLERLDLARHTVIIFVSDNGGLERLQSQAPLRGGKSMLYEGGIRVPLAIEWPGVIAPGQVSRELVITHDLFSTIMEIAGVPYHKNRVDGVSLIPLLTGESTTLGREALNWHYPHYHNDGGVPSGAIRMGRYKLIEWYEGALAGIGPVASLFDLEGDIGETRNLVDDEPELARSLLERHRAWRRSVNAQEVTVRR